MKTVTGRVMSAEPISLSKAAVILSRFVSSETEASQDVTTYLRRASAAFTELKSFHRDIRSTKPNSERNLTDEFEELRRAKGFDELVANGEKIRSRESETVTGEESVHGREQEIKEKKKKKKNKVEDVVVEEKLEDEERKKKRKKNKEEQWSEERKEKKKKKKKSKENKGEDLIDENVEEEQRSEETKEEKKERKKRKSDGEIGSEERKSKKKRRSKEIEG